MNYKVGQGIVAGCFVVAGLAIFSFTLLPLIVVGAFFTAGQIEYDIVHQRLNIDCFERAISESDQITVSYGDAKYDDLGDDFVDYYMNTHDACAETTSHDVVADLAVIVADCSYSFVARYSSSSAYFVLEYTDDPHPDELSFWNRPSKCFSYASADVEALIGFL